MPSPQIVALTPPSLPPGYCFTTWQQLAFDLFTGAFGVIASSVGLGFNYGNAVPSADNQDKAWVRLNPDGSPDRTYSFAFGRWVSKYTPVPAGPNDWRGIWVGSLGDLYFFDGGDGTDPSVVPPTNVTGTFYEVDTAFEFRVPVGVGKFPISGLVTSVGDLGGLDMVSLTVQEMPPHTHTPQAEGQAGKPANQIWGSSQDGSGGGVGATGPVYPGNDGLQSGAGSSYRPINTTLKDAGGDTSVTPVIVKPHDNMPPYFSVYYIKRTIRAYWTP